MREHRTLLVMSALALLGGLYIFFFEKDMASTDEKRDLEKKVLTVESDDVFAIEIAWDERKVRLERERPAKEETDDDEIATPAPDPEWFLREPSFGETKGEAKGDTKGETAPAADRSSVDGLLSQLTGLEKERTLEEVDRSVLDFEEPRAFVKLTYVQEDGDGDVTLEIGPEVVASTDMLLAVAGEAAVYQVAGQVWDDLVREPGDWRDKKLFHGNRNDIERLSLVDGETKVLLARRGEDFWIESPITDRADEELVDGLLSELTGLRADAFLDNDEAALLDDNRVLEAVLKGRSEPLRIVLGPVRPHADEESSAEEAARTHTARVGGQVVTLKTSLATELERPASEWRSRSWTPRQVYEIDRAVFTDNLFTPAVLEDAGGSVEVRRDGSDWYRVVPSGGSKGGEHSDKIGYAAATDVLYAVADARAVEVLDRDALPSGEPDLTVVLGDESSEETLTLHLLDEGRAAVTAAGRDAVLVLGAEGVAEIRAKLGDLRSAEAVVDVEEEAEASEASEDDG